MSDDTLMYEMLTGEPPHTGATSQAIMARLLTETLRRVRAMRAAVSLDGGGEPVWSRSERELFYISSANEKIRALEKAAK